MSIRIEDESERTEFHKLPDPEQVKAVKRVLDPETDPHKAWARIRQMKHELEQAS